MIVVAVALIDLVSHVLRRRLINPPGRARAVSVNERA